MTTAADRAHPGRIAFFVRALAGGGAQRDTILLANELAARGYAVDLMTLVPEGPLRRLVHQDVVIVTVGGGKLRSALPGLCRALIERRPRALISAEAAPNLVALFAARLLPHRIRQYVVLREVSSPSIARRLDPYRQNRIAYRVLRIAYRFADVVLTLTEGARRDLGGNFGVPENRLVRMPANSVLERAVADRPSAQRERGLLVSVGRLSSEKDYPTLIRAFAKLGREDMRLEIAGDGPMRRTLQILIDELGVGDRVRLLGFVADPFSVFRRAELAISSSRYEGFGNAIVEALACGTPVVATDCPYGPREILAGGGCGILVPVADADALARGITQALATRYDRTELHARAGMHTAARAVDALLGVIRSLDGRTNARDF